MAINLEVNDIVKRIMSKINDPHNLLNITSTYINEMIGEIAHSDKYKMEDKLAFLAHLQDMRRKKNLSDILRGALPLLNKETDISAIDSDWVADFVDKAETFVDLSRFCFYDYKTNEAIPIVFLRANPDTYKNTKLAVDALKELEQLSLVECNFDGEYIVMKRKILKYTNYTIDIQAPIIPAGNIRLTDNGRALFNMIEKRNNDQILEHILMYWEYKKCTVNTQQ